MGMLTFTGNKRSMKRLSKVQNSIDKFLKNKPKRLNKRDHATLSRLLKKRAKALSKATGMKIHSVCN